MECGYPAEHVTGSNAAAPERRRRMSGRGIRRMCGNASNDEDAPNGMRGMFKISKKTARAAKLSRRRRGRRRTTTIEDKFGDFADGGDSSIKFR